MRRSRSAVVPCDIVAEQLSLLHTEVVSAIVGIFLSFVASCFLLLANSAGEVAARE